jgi:hypothetical protein
MNARAWTVVAALGATLGPVAWSAGCHEGAPPPVGPVVASLEDAAADTILPHDALAPSTAELDARSKRESEAAAPDLYACALDHDCVAVPKVGCCVDGFLEAVNASYAKAYAASFACPDSGAPCPQGRVNDNRTPLCSDVTRHCEMVTVSEIACGGPWRNAHECPRGWHCVLPAKPNSTGACAKD